MSGRGGQMVPHELGGFHPGLPPQDSRLDANYQVLLGVHLLRLISPGKYADSGNECVVLSHARTTESHIGVRVPQQRRDRPHQAPSGEGTVAHGGGSSVHRIKSTASYICALA